MLDDLAAEFFARRPELRFAALGSRENASVLDLAPFGIQASFIAAEDSPELVRQYLAANALAFPSALALPGWVLSDLYLLPGAIGLLLGPASLLPQATRATLGLDPDDEAILGAYFAAPSIVPGTFIGVSLFALAPKIGIGTWVKALTLRMLGAKRLRGVAQWKNPSMRVHVRLGLMRIISRTPGTHELDRESFVYETVLDWRESMGRSVDQNIDLTKPERVPYTNIDALVDRAVAGDRIYVVPPGVEDDHVFVRRIVQTI